MQNKNIYDPLVMAGYNVASQHPQFTTNQQAQRPYNVNEDPYFHAAINQARGMTASDALTQAVTLAQSQSTANYHNQQAESSRQEMAQKALQARLLPQILSELNPANFNENISILSQVGLDPQQAAFVASKFAESAQGIGANQAIEDILGTEDTSANLFPEQQNSVPESMMTQQNKKQKLPLDEETKKQARALAKAGKHKEAIDLIREAQNPKETTFESELSKKDASALAEARETINDAIPLKEGLNDLLKIQDELPDLAFGKIVGNASPFVSAKAQAFESAANAVTSKLRTLLKFPASSFSKQDLEFLQKASVSLTNEKEANKETIDRLNRIIDHGIKYTKSLEKKHGLSEGSEVQEYEKLFGGNDFTKLNDVNEIDRLIAEKQKQLESFK